jgi:hypothetical protein
MVGEDDGEFGEGEWDELGVVFGGGGLVGEEEGEEAVMMGETIEGGRSRSITKGPLMGWNEYDRRRCRCNTTLHYASFVYIWGKISCRHVVYTIQKKTQPHAITHRRTFFEVRGSV